MGWSCIQRVGNGSKPGSGFMASIFVTSSIVDEEALSKTKEVL
jgi:hypothetical protein